MIRKLKYYVQIDMYPNCKCDNQQTVNKIRDLNRYYILQRPEVEYSIHD